MAGPMIDSLLQTPPPARATSAPRGSDGRGTFAPVLDEALQADAQDSVDDGALESADVGGDESTATASDEVCGTAGEGAADDQDLQATASNETAAAQEDDDDREDEESNADVVEISAEAAAAAEAAAVTAVASSAVAVDADGVEAVALEAQTEDPAATQSPEQGGQDAAAAQETELEFGDVLAETPDLVGVPGKLKTLNAAEAAAHVKRTKAAGNTDVAETQDGGAETESTRGKTAKETAKDTSVDPATESARDEIIDRAVAADHEAKRESTPAPAAPEVIAPIVEAAEEATRSDGAPPKAEPTNIAAPVAPASAGDAGAASRSAAAIARLTADRTASTATTTAEEFDRTRFVGRVEGAIRTAQQRDGRVQVRLSPPELGALRIELSMQNGVLSARLEAETPAARNLLLDNLPALRERLAQQDVRIDRFDVDVRRDGGGSAGGQQQDNAHDRPAQEPAWRQAQQRQDRAGAAKLAAPTRRIDPTTNAALDVRV